MAGRKSTYFFLWQLSRLMEGKFRRRDDWVLMAGVCLTAGAPGWMSPGLVWWGDVAAAEGHGLYSASQNGPRSRLGMAFKGWGARISVSLRPSWAGVRLSESSWEG
jgi:hypothetical protein